MSTSTSFSAPPDSQGKFGRFGGRFVPETLMPAITRLEAEARRAFGDDTFQAELALHAKHWIGRPTPLYRADRIGDRWGASVYLKREDLAHTGAHKINNAIGQCLLAKRLGATRIIAETGAGQHGVATAAACAKVGLAAVVYMGAEDVQRQAPNVDRMRRFGAEVVPVTSGDQTLRAAIDEALRDWVSDPINTHYLIGSAVGPHPFPWIVRSLQSVIGRETRAQLLDATGSLPDAAVACVGGGSNAIGFFHGFLDDPSVAIYGVEAGGNGTDRHAATISHGAPAGVLHGSYSALLQDDHGQILETHSVSAGLDYSGIGPEHAHLADIGRVTYTAATDTEALRTLDELCQREGILPALESAHALAGAKAFAKNHPGATIAVCLSGRGDKDAPILAKHPAQQIDDSQTG